MSLGDDSPSMTPPPPPPKSIDELPGRSRIPNTLRHPAHVHTAESMREHGGLDAYTQHVREWWAWRKDQSVTQRKDRTLLLSGLVRVLSQSDDHDWASAIPQGLFLAAARAAGKKVHEQPRVRGDPGSRARLRALVANALLATLSVAERDAECERLLFHGGDCAVKSSQDNLLHGGDCAVKSSQDNLLHSGGHSAATEESLAGVLVEVRTDMPITLKELMGPIVNEVAAETRSRLVRASCAARALEEFGVAIDASALLPLRCVVLSAYLRADDAEGARRWGRTIHRDWLPQPVQTRWREMLGHEPIGDEAVDDTAASHPPPSLALTAGGRAALPAALLEAGRLAVDGWSSSSFQRGRGRHGALVLRAQDGVVLGRGCNASEATKQSGGVRGGVHGKFVVHAEMNAVRQALEASGGALTTLRGATVYLARLAPLGEYYEDAAPCERCEEVLRACGIARVVWTASAGEVCSCEYVAPSTAPTCAAEVPAVATTTAPKCAAEVPAVATAAVAAGGSEGMVAREEAEDAHAGAPADASDARCVARLSDGHCQWMGVARDWVH